MSISTKRGDGGETDLLYGGRVPKYDLRTEAYGALHEALAAMGLARALIPDEDLKGEVLRIQKELFILGAELATTREHLHRLKERMGPERVAVLDEKLQAIEARHPIKDWVMPGENPASAAMEFASTVLRRAERWAVRLKDEGLLENPHLLAYLNRLADLLFMYARLLEPRTSGDSGQTTLP